MPNTRTQVIEVRNPGGGTRKAIYAHQGGSWKFKQADGTTPTRAITNVIPFQLIEYETTLEGGCLGATITAGSTSAPFIVGKGDLITIWEPDPDAQNVLIPAYVGEAADGSGADPDFRDGITITTRNTQETLRDADTGPNREWPQEIKATADLMDVGVIAWEVARNSELPPIVSSVIKTNIGLKFQGSFNAESVDLYQVLSELAGYCEAAGIDVRFGIDAYGRLYFKPKATGVGLIVQEADEDVIIERRQPSPERVITAVRWLIGQGTETWKLWKFALIQDNTPDALTHVSFASDNGGYGWRYAHLQAPEQAIRPLNLTECTYSLSEAYPTTVVASYVATTEDETPQLNRIGDANPASYAILETEVGTEIHITVPENIPYGDFVGFQIALEVDESSDDITAHQAYISGLGDDIVGRVPLTGQNPYQVTARFEGGPNVQRALVWGDRARTYSASLKTRKFADYIAVRLLFDLPAGNHARIAIADLRPLILDRKYLDGSAVAEYAIPHPSPFAITHKGKPTPPVILTAELRDGSELEGRPDSIIYRQTPEEGFVTTWEVGRGLRGNNDLERRLERGEITAEDHRAHARSRTAAYAARKGWSK